jgi:trigger factor
MKTTVKNLPKCIVQITVSDSATEYEKARTKALADLSTRVEVKGFRKGAKVPAALVLKEIGESRLADEALDIYLKKIYPKMLADTQITPVAPGNVVEITSLDPLVLVIEIETLPVATLDMKKVSAIKLKKTPVTADPSETTEALAEIEKKFTHYHESGMTHGDGFDATDAKIAESDRVTIDTQGFESKGGTAIVETRVMDFPLVIGSGQFIPGFETELIGKTSGSEVAFDITFPADYHSDAFKGRKVHFVTTIKLVEKAHKPTWTPEFIEQLRGVKTDLAGFKEILAQEILGEKERKARELDEKVLLEKLNDAATLEVGDGLVSKEAESIWSEQKSNLEAQGYSMKTYLEHMGMSEASYRDTTIATEANRRVRAEIILKTLKDTLKIEADDTEITLEINKIISQYQNPEVVARLKAKLIPGDGYYEDIRSRLAYRKVVDSFFTK